MLAAFRIRLDPVSTFCLSMMVGVPVISLAPCFLQLFALPMDLMTVAVAVAAVAVISGGPWLFRIRKPKFHAVRLPQLYEVPFLIAIIILVFISVWRCYYYPPYARDMLAGPELIAEYAVREKTLINSVYGIDLHTTNNHFKSPFITTLQVIYKLLVTPFGALWLSVLFVSFTIWLYTLLRQRIHGFLAGFLLFIFLTVPELYAYTYMVLYDYSNMIFFFAGFCFLIKYVREYQMNTLLFAGFLFGLATYIRTETVVLVAMIVPLLFVYQLKNKFPLKANIIRNILLLCFPVFFYMLCINVFVRLFVPVPFDVAGQVNTNLADISVFFKRIWDVQHILIVSEHGLEIYGFFILFFYALLLTDILWQRKFNIEAVFSLYGVGVVLIGLPFLGYLLPLLDLPNSTKRGLFKMFPLMLLYMANSSSLQYIAALLQKWEYSVPGNKKA